MICISMDLQYRLFCQSLLVLLYSSERIFLQIQQKKLTLLLSFIAVAIESVLPILVEAKRNGVFANDISAF